MLIGPDSSLQPSSASVYVVCMVDKQTSHPSANRTHTMRVAPETWSRGELLAVAMGKTGADILRHTAAPAPVPSTASVLRVALGLGLDELERRVAAGAHQPSQS